MNDLLKTFYVNTVVKDAVYYYLIDFLKDVIIERAFLGKDVKDIAEAKSVIEKAFANLDSKYSPPKSIKDYSK